MKQKSFKQEIELLWNNIICQLTQKLQKELEILKQNANAVAQWDILSCFAKTALKNNYCRPMLTQGNELTLKGARHPVIEQQLPLGTPYIANDLELDRDTQQIMMITGPNMSGKSAILRQTALISLLAQLGSYVPATTSNFR